MLVEGYKKLFTDLKSPKTATAGKNQFANAYLAVMNNLAVNVTQGVTSESLNVLRSKFVLEWFEKYGDKYPYRLFEYQRQLLKEGLFDAYNEWAFGASLSLTGFQNWTTQHQEDYNRFIAFQKGRVFVNNLGIIMNPGCLSGDDIETCSVIFASITLKNERHCETKEFRNKRIQKLCRQNHNQF